MPTQPSEILALAGRIRDANHGECGFRSAASRAYYAAMHQTESVFGKAVPAQDSSHEQVIRAAAEYGRGSGPEGGAASALSASLNKMRLTRNVADYRLAEQFTEAQCRDMFIRANAVFAGCVKVAAAKGSRSPAPSDATSQEHPAPPPGPRPSLTRIR